MPIVLETMYGTKKENVRKPPERKKELEATQRCGSPAGTSHKKPCRVLLEKFA